MLHTLLRRFALGASLPRATVSFRPIASLSNNRLRTQIETCPWSFSSFVRGLITTQTTPNPNSLKFFAETQLVAAGSFDFPSSKTAEKSPLAKRLFRVTGVTGVFISNDFVTVTKIEDVSWQSIKPDIFSAISSFTESGKPAIEDGLQNDAIHQDSNDEVVQLILELLDTRIRPSVQEDGGDIVFKKFEDGIVYLKLMGSCSGCPSSLSTLKNGIENMLMHYVPEVEEVREAPPEDKDPIAQQ
eukprot:TRINITY_DN1424_c0_g1_i1.p1 TRINITY_DN1424_c0_g1~~TRINITY_DN1424_c0_g1_i1.p1  ORF type:complete len:243 (-),score=57.39 TRINITY_DN1424_c0_g1_i1:93-821(-)